MVFTHIKTQAKTAGNFFAVTTNSQQSGERGEPPSGEEEAVFLSDHEKVDVAFLVHISNGKCVAHPDEFYERAMAEPPTIARDFFEVFFLQAFFFFPGFPKFGFAAEAEIAFVKMD